MTKDKRLLEIAGLLTEVEYKFHIDIPKSIVLIYNAFIKHGKKLYVVGGAVRDSYMGMKPKDFDLATDASPDVVQSILNTEGISNFPKGESFGVISAIVDEQEFEIATFRQEDYTGADGRRPNVDSIVYTDISNDSKRRDLTINALYYDVERETIIDLVGGIEDINNKRIRTVGNPMDRFTEDRLRTLRALRFAHRFGSSLDKDTIDAIIHFKDLSGVSAERIRNEFLAALKSSVKPEEFIQQFMKLGLMPRTFPGLDINTNFIPGLRSPLLAIAKLLENNNPQKVAKVLNTSSYSTNEIDSIMFLYKLKDKFNGFDKVVFNPITDSSWLLELVSKRNLALFRTSEKGGLSKEEISTWGKINGLNSHIISTFIEFNPPYSAKDFPDMPQGKELGMKISAANGNYFLKGL